MKVKNTIKTYEENGLEIKGLNPPEIHVESHPFYNDRIRIVFPDGRHYTVLAGELQKAIANATNHGKWL